MTAQTDAQLLQACDTAERSEAIAELVRRHVGFVFGCALRQVHGDSHLAEDVAQAVFILLARKAPHLRREVILREWLFVTTRYAAKNAMKMEARRRYHERRAAALRTDVSADESQLHELLPLLDEAIARLAAPDRAGVLLSYFDRKTYREVGAALGVSEEAARKRVGRAVEKMRSFFGARGIALPGAAAPAVASALQAHSGTAPGSLIQSVTSAALGSAGASGAAGCAAYAIAKGASKMFMLAKLKFAAAAVAASVVIASSGVAIVESTSWADQAKSPATQPAANADGKAVAQFDDGVAIEIVGISHNPPDPKSWWTIDGSPTAEACDPSTSIDQPPYDRTMCLRVSGVPEDAGVVWLVPANGWSMQPALKGGASLDHTSVMTLASKQQTIDVRCRVAMGDWENIYEHKNIDGASCTSSDSASIAFAPAYEKDGRTYVTVSYEIPDRQVRVIAVDGTGAEHDGHIDCSTGTKAFSQITAGFEPPMKDIDRLVVQARTYNHIAEFKDVTLDPQNKTNARVIATKN